MRLTHLRSRALLVSASLVPSAIAAAPPSASYRLNFADEFNGTTLDSNRWLDQYPWGRTHNHEAYVASSNVLVGNGELTLRAQRIGQGGKPFTSGAISTGYTKYRFNGGYAEARVKLPTTAGSWPAFWGLDNGWPPEADIMEFPLTTDGVNGYPNTDYHTAFHYVNGSGGNSAGAGRVNPASAGDLTTTYHTYGMEWIEDSSVRFFFDGVQVSSFTNAAVAQMTSMYLIMNYAVGGWPGTPSLAQWPANHSDDTKVDWIRVWQTNPSGDVTTHWNLNGSGSFASAANWTAGAPNYSNEIANFGRVGNASAAVILMATWQVFGGITFSGGGDGTTAYTVGTTAALAQLANSNGAIVQANASSTVNQSINARLELWSSTTFRNDMTSGQTLSLNSQISGNGVMTIEGVSPVVISSANNIYTGGTVINGTTQGPAVLRVNANGALGTGGVIIGTAGNATQARLEITGGRTIANNIDFRGRTNDSIGIQSLAGNNVLQGTVTANVGGGIYRIRSDADTLTLTGSAAGATVAGVAIQAVSGTRNITLEGAGNGLISGKIQNGGGIVAITKEGTGQWTLGADNNYTGGTTINNGTLDASHQRAFSGATLTVNGGAAKIASGPLATSVSAMTLTGSGKVDVNDSAMVITNLAATPHATTVSRVKSGAISSGMTNAGSFAVGYATASELQYASFRGNSFPGNASLLATTYRGDANLSGGVDSQDFNALIAGFGTTSAGVWHIGDFDYNDKVNTLDFNLLAGNFGLTFAPSAADPGFLASTVVPEPISGLLAVLACGMIRRRR